MTTEYKPKIQGEMEVIKRCREVTEHTLRILSNEKYFKKRQRWILAGKIADLINDFFDSVNIANTINVKTASDAKTRAHYQSLAIAQLKTVSRKMDMAISVLGMDVNEIHGWTSNVNHELKLLSAWKASDEKRYCNL